jgi:putative Ca2+/H+ antiporter (TMEM165/GDT1 family)
VDLSLLAAVFGIIFVAELPDKTALASLVLGTRYRPSAVLIGVAAAFALHVIIAVAAGSALSLAPRWIVEAVVAVLFLAGAVLMLRRGGNSTNGNSTDTGNQGPDDHDAPANSPPALAREAVWGPTCDEHESHRAMAVLTQARSERGTRRGGFWKVAVTSFGVLFVAEFGDLTQIATANLVARYHAPLTVGVGAVLGLWAVGGLAILGGRQLLRWIPLAWIARAAALIMAALGLMSTVNAITGG